jgi:hypothetical protein
MILDKRKAKINTAKRLSTIEGEKEECFFLWVLRFFSSPRIIKL